MIKAEIISHEGNPGPNWLDRCRSVATPVNVTVVALLVIGGALFIGLTKKDQSNTANKLPTTSNSQQSSQPNSNTLQVQPLGKFTTNENGSQSVQSATGGGAGATTSSPAQGNTAAPISAPKTPALNNSNANQVAPQTPLTGTNLINKLQSTVQSVPNTVNRTVNGLTNSLGL